MLDYKITSYGFEYGSAKVERIASDWKKGWVVLIVETAKGWVQIYCTKSGNIRVTSFDKKNNISCTDHIVIPEAKNP